MNVEKLLCNPTGVNRESTLHVDLLQEFLNAEIVAPTDLLKNVNHTPLWVLWLAENNDKPQATSLLIHTLSQIPGFSWAKDFENSEHDSQSPLDAVGQYLTSQQLIDILNGLSTKEISHLQSKPLTTASSFGLKKMVRAEREDLFEILLKFGWDINIQNEDKRSLLMDCARWKDAQMVLKHHPDLDVVDIRNNNILDCVRLWSHGGDFNEILKQVNAHRTHQSTNPIDKTQQKLFEIIASQKVADLKKNLKELKSLPSSVPLQDAQNRTPLLIMCENLRFQRNPIAQGAYGRFFVRFLNAFLPELKKYPHFSKDQPLSTVPGWSEYDHTMMTLIVNCNHAQGRFPCDLLSDELKKAMNDWSVARLPQLKSTLDAWTTLYLNDFMAHTYSAENANVKAALNVCNFLGTNRLMPCQQLLFKNWAGLDHNSQVFHHLLDKWIEEGAANKNYSHQTVFRSYGVGSFACMWALENTIEPHSDFECSLVKFVMDQMHQSVVYIHNNKSLNAPVFAIMDSKFVECAQNHPQLCTSWIEKIKNDLNEHASSFDSPEHEEIVHRIQACVEKIVLLENLPSLGEKSCTRKM